MKLTSFFGNLQACFSAEKEESQRFYLPLPSQRSLIGIAAKKIQGHFAAKQNKIAKAK